MSLENQETGSIKPLPRLLFDVYALTLPRGHGFGQRPPTGAWQREDGISYGVITQHVETGDIGILVMRRRIDHTWAEIANETGLASQDVAMGKIEHLLQDGSSKEPMPPNTAPRPDLTDFGFLCTKVHEVPQGIRYNAGFA